MDERRAAAGRKALLGEMNCPPTKPTNNTHNTHTHTGTHIECLTCRGEKMARHKMSTSLLESEAANKMSFQPEEGKITESGSPLTVSDHHACLPSRGAASYERLEKEAAADSLPLLHHHHHPPPRAREQSPRCCVK